MPPRAALIRSLAASEVAGRLAFRGCSNAGRGVSPSPCTRGDARRRSAAPPSEPRPRSRIGAAARPLPPRAGGARAPGRSWYEAGGCGRSSHVGRHAHAGRRRPRRIGWHMPTSSSPCSCAPSRPLRLGEDQVGSEPRLALGRPLRPAREPPRRRPRRLRRLPPEVPTRAVRACFCPASTWRQSPPSPSPRHHSLGFGRVRTLAWCSCST